MFNRKDHSTLEPVQNQDNQPGLEFDPRYSLLKYESNSIGDAIVKENEQKILGLRRKTLIIVAAIVALVVITIVGGAVGGVKSKKRVSPSPISQPPPTSPSPLPATNLLYNSSLASVNWTMDGLQYYGVFFQNKNNNIFMSLWDPKTKNWTSSPIGIDKPLNPLPGTHIAAAAWPTDKKNTTQVNIYITSKDDELLEFWTQDPYAGNNWTLGQLSNTNPRPRTTHSSQLAVHYWGCYASICRNSPVLLYQNQNQTLLYTNTTDRYGWIGANLMEDGDLEPGTAIAMMSLAPGGNDQSFSTDSKLPYKAYIGKGGIITEYTWQTGPSEWKDEEGFYKGLTKPKAPLALSATTMPSITSPGSPTLLLIGLYLEGDVRSLKVMSGVGNNWNPPTLPQMTKAISNITAIATNFDRRFYGMSDGLISEYEIDRDTLSWNFTSMVKT